MKKLAISVALLAVGLSGCVSAEQHRAAVSNPVNDRITVGTVQREVKIGMASADVVQVLGAPNMVSTDDQRREVWVYDKIASDIVTSSSGFSLGALGGVAGGIAGAGLGGSYGSNAGATSTSQRTLTIIIKYDAAGRVRDYSYRTSSF